MTSTPTRPVDNVVITTKGLQDRNINILEGTTVENKGKLILNVNKHHTIGKFQSLWSRCAGNIKFTPLTPPSLHIAIHFSYLWKISLTQSF